MRCVEHYAWLAVLLCVSIAAYASEDGPLTFDDAWSAFDGHYNRQDYASCLPYTDLLLSKVVDKYPPKTEPDRYLAVCIRVSHVYNVLHKPEKIVGLFKDALSHLESALGHEDPHLSTCLLHLGIAQCFIGNDEQAERTWRRGLDIAHGSRDRLSEATFLGNLATVHDIMGDYVGSLLSRHLALQIYETLEPSEATAENAGRLLVALAGTYALMGNSPISELFLSKGQSYIHRTLGPAALVNVSIVHDRAYILMLQGKYAEAEPLLAFVVNAFGRARSPNDPLNSRTAAQYAECLAVLGRREPARKWIDEAFRTAGDRTSEMEHYSLGWVCAYEGNWGQAWRALDVARRRDHRQDIYRLRRMPDSLQLSYLAAYERPRLHRALSLALSRNKDSDAVTKSYEWWLNAKALSFDGVRQRMSGIVSSTLKATEREELRAVAARLLECEVTAANHAIALSDVRIVNDSGETVGLELQRYVERQKVVEESGELVRRLTATDVNVDDKWLTMAEVRALLPRGTVLIDVAKISYWTFPAPAVLQAQPSQRYVAWIIPSAKDEVSPCLVNLGAAEPVDAAVRRLNGFWRQASIAVNSGSEAELAVGGLLSAAKLRGVALTDLSKSVWAPIEAQCPGKPTSWIISPDSNLWNVPWEALTTSENKYLVQSATDIRYILNGRDLVPQPVTASSAPPVSVIDPGFADGKAIDVDALSEQVRRAYGENLLNRQSDALGAAEFLKLTRPVALIVNTHGLNDVRQLPQPDFKAPTSIFSGQVQVMVRPNPLLLTVLVMSEKFTRPQDVRLSNEAVTGAEIAGMDLRATQLVYLAACLTATNEAADREGESLPTLRAAFHLAGARSVVGALWEIPAEQTRTLANLFWTKHAETKIPSIALVHAKRQMIAREFSHPYYWAAMTVTTNQ